MFVKYLISSIESLYMQMIHANYINNNIPGSERSALVHCPGFNAANNSQYAAFMANAKETGGKQTGEGGMEPDPPCSVLGGTEPGTEQPQPWEMLVQSSRAQCSKQGRRVCKSLSLSAMQQCTSTFPSPLLPCSSHPAFLFILLLSLLTTGLCTSTASSVSEECVTKQPCRQHAEDTCPKPSPCPRGWGSWPICFGCPPKVLMLPGGDASTEMRGGSCAGTWLGY